MQFQSISESTRYTTSQQPSGNGSAAHLIPLCRAIGCITVTVGCIPPSHILTYDDTATRSPLAVLRRKSESLIIAEALANLASTVTTTAIVEARSDYYDELTRSMGGDGGDGGGGSSGGGGDSASGGGEGSGGWVRPGEKRVTSLGALLSGKKGGNGSDGEHDVDGALQIAILALADSPASVSLVRDLMADTVAHKKDLDVEIKKAMAKDRLKAKQLLEQGKNPAEHLKPSKHRAHLYDPRAAVKHLVHTLCGRWHDKWQMLPSPMASAHLGETMAKISENIEHAASDMLLQLTIEAAVGVHTHEITTSDDAHRNDDTPGGGGQVDGMEGMAVELVDDDSESDESDDKSRDSDVEDEGGKKSGGRETDAPPAPPQSSPSSISSPSRRRGDTMMRRGSSVADLRATMVG
mmetsp:Transcript_22594/g.58727  ORF Transcript_22594/g.58727 Transcript_22594/m.58727 type:complete len:408 (-) Transcript_22594:1271-2494(-)